MKAQGLDALAVFATLLLVLQSFVGLPIASFCLKRESTRLVEAFRAGETGTIGNSGKTIASDPEVPSWRLFPQLPKSLQTPFVLIAKALLIGWLAVKVADLTGGVIHPFVVALVFGIIFYELGFIEHKILEKANAAGLALFILLVPVFMNLSQATPAMVGSLILPMIGAFVIALAGMLIVSFVLSRILDYSWELSLAISTTCLFGFPATYIISEEVSESQSRNGEEKEFLIKQILPKMLVAGFTTVTIASVILAGIIVNLL